MIKVEYKMRKVRRNGIVKFVPLVRRSILGWGKWKEDPEWAAVEKRIAEEKWLGLEVDSTVTQISAFIAARVPSVDNKFYDKDRST